ncbi:FAD-linked oxidoreductase ZEB1 [Lachnellula suecica]|uniref:FAD-linked oxidoreductase ZEB1 n=1 Tax=Lachnellula suecica TaxID=602035 RepID=A0A8T9CK92_9HELO|nr:FAD-linked oxidoreductase ZEB1 [Lachnellula suecica]
MSCFLQCSLVLSFMYSGVLAAPSLFGGHAARASSSSCRCFPGDSCWPSNTEWSEFNTTLGGKLIATVPIGSVCHHDPFAAYDAEACSSLQAAWFNEDTHYGSSSSVMAPFFANQSCDPFLPDTSRCVIGTYIQYAVNASDATDYQKALEFGQLHNIRLVIRNTGHDYLGKSTGAGALGIWTHYMKNIDFLDYTSPNYAGKAIKLGAGVQGHEAYAAAKAEGLVVVGGNCPTVGIAGGYSQGGGTGPLGSRFGMAADQVLEWEVVTASGELLIATPSNNSDLYWALSGGGGGVYGVVVSMTSKAHADMPSSAANLTFTNNGVSQDAFWGAVSVFHETLPAIVDAGGVSVWGFTNASFSMTPTYGPNITASQMSNLLQPVIQKLNANNISFTYAVKSYSDFLSSYDDPTMNPFIATSAIQLGGRIIPRSLVESNNSALTSAFQKITALGGGFSGIAMSVGGSPANDNAVNPEWRTALFDAVIYTLFDYTSWEANLVSQDLITDVLIPELATLTPGGGSYLNEADFRTVDWKDAFYGSNYDALKSVKDKYDPEGVFYALTGVGSDAWVEEADGRLCKTS